MLVETRMEERLKAYDQEMLGMKLEISKLPAIEEKLTMTMTKMEILSVQTEKTKQMMMMFMESIAKEWSAMSDKVVESSMRETLTMKPK